MSVIRSFRSEDAGSCCSLIQDCLSADSSLSVALRKKLQDSETPQSMEERSKSFYLAVYELESGIVGIAGLDLNEIRLLYVSPGRRRSGIGRSLFNHMAAMIPESFFKEMFVYSSPLAVNFYKSLGFAEKGRMRFDIWGEPLDTVFMTRPTAPPEIPIP
jgi:N-acetylglutamate synthase-like GNAT family acetyltransferase